MKSRDLDIDYLFLLEALEGGVDPGAGAGGHAGADGAGRTHPAGFVLTMDAQVKLRTCARCCAAIPCRMSLPD
jgi:hypothetical protein